MAARKKKAAKRATKKRATTTKKKASKASSKKAPARRKKATAKKTVSRKKASASEAPFGEVEALVELMDKHGLLELDYKSGPDGTREVRLSRVGSAAAPVFAPAAAVAAPAASAAPTAGSNEAAETPTATEGLVPFKSPMVGSFYRAPSPEASPFVSVGDTIDSSSVVCIIEAMKVMNEITPDVRGEIASIEVENGEAVEFGQTLFLVRPT